MSSPYTHLALLAHGITITSPQFEGETPNVRDVTYIHTDGAACREPLFLLFFPSLFLERHSLCTWPLPSQASQICRQAPRERCLISTRSFYRYRQPESTKYADGPV
ncbi:hypothetical protein LX36DRAFT_358057 [Colletotrichum falcatum]|nr:hypothetical protein LX36DRAFT_358057 [Colletotrichum falcatum]